MTIALTDRITDIGTYTIEHGSIEAAMHFDIAPSTADRNARLVKAAAKKANKRLNMKKSNKNGRATAIGET